MMTLLRLMFEFAKTGLFSVGGGLATLPFLYEMSDATGWFTHADIADMIAISESTPGAIGINMSTYAGYTTAGVPGGILATLSLAAPADGELIPMEEIPDTAFASGTLGDCVGILPENGMVYAPCDGVVSGIAQTGHAITFTASDGREVLVHAGLDTVHFDEQKEGTLTKEKMIELLTGLSEDPAKLFFWKV